MRVMGFCAAERQRVAEDVLVGIMNCSADWLRVLPLGEEKGGKQELLCMFVIMAAGPCDLHLLLWQESWSGCTAKQKLQCYQRESS